MGKSFRDAVDPSEGLKSQLKIEFDKVYFLRIIRDELEEWDEIWPSFTSDDGKKIVRRFVSDENDNTALTAVNAYKKQYGIPTNIPKSDHGGWRGSHKNCLCVITGTEILVKNAAGEKVRKFQWDVESPKAWVFGIEIFRQIKGMDSNTDLVDAATEKGVDMEKHSVKDVYIIRLKKTKKGSANYEVDYDVQAGKLTGPVKAGTVDTTNLDKELAAYMVASKDGDVEAFFSKYGAGGEGADDSQEPAAEAPVADDNDDLADIPVLNKKKGATAQPAKKAPAPAVDDDLEVADAEPAEEVVEDEPVAPPPKKKAAAPAPAGKKAPAPAAEIDTSDIDSLLED